MGMSGLKAPDGITRSISPVCSDLFLQISASPKFQCTVFKGKKGSHINGRSHSSKGHPPAYISPVTGYS